jgi:hypothetical protein
MTYVVGTEAWMAAVGEASGRRSGQEQVTTPQMEGRRRKGPAEAAVETECSAAAGKAKEVLFSPSSVLDSVEDRGRSSNYDFGTRGYRYDELVQQ